MNRKQRRAQSRAVIGPSTSTGSPQHDDPGAILASAIQLHRAGRLTEADRFYRQIPTSSPAYPDALHLLGMAAFQRNRNDEALNLVGQAIRLKSGQASYHSNLGVILHRLGLWEQALAACQTATALDPNLADAYVNLGLVLQELGRLDEGLEADETAIRLNPGNPAAHYNQGMALQMLGRQGQAIGSFERAIALQPSYAQAHFALATSRLLLGDWVGAWTEYEWRWLAGSEPPRAIPQPQWRGEDLMGRTILLHAEQGLGDTIQFCSYAALVAARGALVVLTAPPPLMRLLKDVDGIAQLVPFGDPLPAFDVHCPLLSLPGVFGTTVATTPAAPYLRPEAALVERWRERIGDHGFRIGIVWQGNRNAAAERGRSAPLTQFAGLAALPGVRLISLQKGLDPIDLANLPAGVRVEVLGPDFDSGPDAFVDTAAALASLDLMVTVDSAPGALAGALGRPVWVALKTVPHWAWTQTSDRSPWYPSARPFRQTERGDWDGVFARMTRALKDKLGLA